MKRWKSSLFITTYLGVLLFGLLTHALTFLKAVHPAMYFIVWDMYCGWSAYEQRMHIVGEGASGAYYEISPPPWGTFIPYGSCDRANYDHNGKYPHRLAINTLAHTQHEPITRVLLVEESWAKKYNMPDFVWERQYNVPKESYSYYHVLSVLDRHGACLQRSNTWLAHQYETGILDNPRLRADVRKGHTFFASTPGSRRDPSVTPASFEATASLGPGTPAH